MGLRGSQLHVFKVGSQRHVFKWNCNCKYSKLGRNCKYSKLGRNFKFPSGSQQKVFKVLNGNYKFFSGLQPEVFKLRSQLQVVNQVATACFRSGRNSLKTFLAIFLLNIVTTHSLLGSIFLLNASLFSVQSHVMTT